MTNESRPSKPQLWFRVAAWCITAALAMLVSQPVRADQYRAFYYDAKGRLLQVEDVPDSELASRTLININETDVTVPLLTKKDVPLVTGNNKKMHRLAVLAVYYTYSTAVPPATGDKDVQAVPRKIEYLERIDDRLIKSCLARDGSTPCIFPKRCHCMTGACCCY
jgi:hypothetical protein